LVGNDVECLDGTVRVAAVGELEQLDSGRGNSVVRRRALMRAASLSLA
jgi:hypothetical protein